MTEFGARLRRERERRQISLASIAEETKVQASLFEALERDDVSRWPSGIYRRSFVRAYAEAIGLDPDEITQEFDERFPDAGGWKPASGHRSRTGRKRQPELRLTLADPGGPFIGGTLMRGIRSRLAAAVCDLAALLAVGTGAFLLLDSFWLPLSVATICYYVGSILVLGNTPGVCLCARRGRTREDRLEVEADITLSDVGVPQPMQLAVPRDGRRTALFADY